MTFTREQVEQQIAIAYKTGFHVGIKWAEERKKHEINSKRQR